MSKGDTSGLEEMRILPCTDLQPMGIAEALKIDLVEVEKGRAVFAGMPGAHVCKPLGIVHGGLQLRSSSQRLAAPSIHA